MCKPQGCWLMPFFLSTHDLLLYVYHPRVKHLITKIITFLHTFTLLNSSLCARWCGVSTALLLYRDLKPYFSFLDILFEMVSSLIAVLCEWARFPSGGLTENQTFNTSFRTLFDISWYRNSKWEEIGLQHAAQAYCTFNTQLADRYCCHWDDDLVTGMYWLSHLVA